MLNTAEAFHTSHQARYQQKHNIVSGKIRRFAWYRLFSFLLIFIPFFGWGWNGWLTVAPAVVAAAVFFYLIKETIRYEKLKKKYAVLVKLSADELLALNNQFGHFDHGPDFLDP